MSNVLAAIIAATLCAPATPVQNPEAPTETETAEPEAPPAATPTTGADVVHLASGGFIRGTVEEYEPGGAVVILKSDGTRKTLDASEVSRVEIGGQPATAAAPAVVAEAVDDEPAPAVATVEVDDDPAPVAARSRGVGSGRTRLHIVRTDELSLDIALHRKIAEVSVSGTGGSASGTAWETTCRAPCGKSVETEPVYFVGRTQGATLGSAPIDLRPYEGGDVTLEVEGGSMGMFAGSYVLWLSGTLVASSSVVWFMIDDLNNGVGAVMLTTGVAGVVGGLVMLFRSRHRVTAVSGRPRR